MVKWFFHRFRNIAHLFGPKNPIWPFLKWGGGGGGYMSLIGTRSRYEAVGTFPFYFSFYFSIGRNRKVFTFLLGRKGRILLSYWEEKEGFYFPIGRKRKVFTFLLQGKGRFLLFYCEENRKVKGREKVEKEGIYFPIARRIEK